MKMAIRLTYISLIIFVVTLILSYCIPIPKMIPIILGIITLGIDFTIAFIAIIKVMK